MNIFIRFAIDHQDSAGFLWHADAVPMGKSGKLKPITSPAFVEKAEAVADVESMLGRHYDLNIIDEAVAH